MRSLVICCVILLDFLFRPESVWACSCVQHRNSPSVEFEESDAVFFGRVTNIIKPPPIFYGYYLEIIAFEVEDSWKGITETHITVSAGDCGVDFRKGKSYLVYSQEWNGVQGAGICSRTTEITRAAEDLEYLDTVPKIRLRSTMSLQTKYCVIPTVTIIILGLVWRIRRKGKEEDEYSR